MTRAGEGPVPTPATPPTLDSLFESGIISELDYYFARALQSRAPTEDPRLFVAAALASRAVQMGHVCLDLQTFQGAALLDRNERPVSVELPSLAEWQQVLANSELVSQGALSKTEPLPLLFESPHRLYLHRYATYQRRLVDALAPRLERPRVVNEQVLATGLHQLFPQDSALNGDYQCLAAALAVRSRFTIISGGPGTGKTTTVTKILLLLQAQALAQNQLTDRLLLLAPTGKAAQRLTESIEQSLTRLREQGVITEEASAAAAGEAQTIHRALGYQRRTPTRFRHDAQNPLPAEVVLVDEASMVDLALMTKLVEAVSPDARLILLGDKDQLASVEAGAILGDMFNAEAAAGYSPELLAYLERSTLQQAAELGGSGESKPIADCRVQLVHSYRYDDESGIGVLARAVRDGDEATATALLRAPPAGVTFVNTQGHSYARRIAALKNVFREGYAEYARASDVEERLALLAAFRCLSPHRRGPIGVGALNDLASEVLKPMLGANAQAESYAGRAIIVTENDYQMELYNGDTGVLGSSADGTKLFAFFLQQGTLRRLQLSRLPAYETVFAMTVHKSQGSEFDSVALVLPVEPSPVFTRELVYTGLTRARKSVRLIGTESILELGLRTRVQRASGLRQALWR